MCSLPASPKDQNWGKNVVKEYMNIRAVYQYTVCRQIKGKCDNGI